ncbi:hypothetical protein [Streptomyces sp.]|uniref:hypothetical protein n=1 Tax=Streptomyces sp. TaxID=1931 RepID=UPI0039C8E9FE
MHAQIVPLDGFDPLDAIAPREVLCSGGAVGVEPVSAEGPREVVSGTGGLLPRATGALDPGRAGLIPVPGAPGRVAEPGEVPGHDAGAGGWQAGEEVPLSHVVLHDDRLTRKQAVTTPMRLNPAFAVPVTGGTPTGTAKAGRLPASEVTGRRRTARAATEG